MKSYVFVLIVIISIALGFLGGYQYHNIKKENTKEKKIDNESTEPEKLNIKYLLSRLHQAEKKRAENFLEYKQNLKEGIFSDFIEVQITNNTRTVTFKDFSFDVAFKSKTESTIETESFIIYEYIPPQQTKFISKEVDVPEEAESYNFNFKGVAMKDTSFVSDSTVKM